MTERDHEERRADDEAALATRARRGDREAFASLVRRHAPIAHRAAYLITRSGADADDALQEGTVKAWRSLGRYQEDRPFRPWFVTIVANEARNRARSHHRQQALRLRLDHGHPDPGPEHRVIEDERNRELARHLDALPDGMRDAVALRHLVGLTERETAAALGIRPGTVKSRVARGLDRLRTSMDGQWT